MQIKSTKNFQPARPKAAAPAKNEGGASLSGVADSIADGYHSLPRYPRAMVRGAASYAPASIGAMIGSQYGGFVGRVAGAAIGSFASYKFLTDVAEAYPRQARVTSVISGVMAAVQASPGLTLPGVGMSLAWGAGIGAVQEFAMGGR